MYESLSLNNLLFTLFKEGIIADIRIFTLHLRQLSFNYFFPFSRSLLH